MTSSIELTAVSSGTGGIRPEEAGLYLFRHGLTRYNLEKRYQGRSDLPLTEEERKRLGPYHPDLFAGEEACVYVSPALRARQTAALLFPGARQIVIPEFSEMDFGVFEGRSADEMASDPLYRGWVDSMCRGPVPGGEHPEQFKKRVTDRFCQLALQTLASGKKRLVIVAHGGTQMAVMERFCNKKQPYWSWQSRPGEAVMAVIQEAAQKETVQTEKRNVR